MNLEEGQRRQVAEWIEQGLKLSEIQTRIGKEFGVSMTYIDVRFLIDDLKLRPKDTLPPTSVTLAPAQKPASGPGPGGASPEPAPAPANAAGGVSVTVDTVARPGAIVSGRVSFSDGQGGAWLIDQTGRPGLVPDQQGYRPSQPDIVAFQTKLQDELARLGF